MVFSSTVFLFAFLPLAFGVYCLLPGMRAKNGWLVVVSLLFYAFGEPVAVFLMIGETIFNWLTALLLSKQQGRRKTALLVLTVAVDIGALFIFKYLGFFCGVLSLLPGLTLTAPTWQLPLGISFFTFQALSYVIDVYRGTVAVQRSYPKVLLYVAFFPQLIAGPIVKYHDIETQLANRTLDAHRCAAGVRRFICGMAKKLLIANQMAIVVDSLFGMDAALISLPSAWLAGISYLFQLYFDFSGYSDMAIGLGLLFGFTFPENFAYPLAAGSMRQFWRRWHISLTTWFRDYLYIPLGGNRKGRRRKDLNTMLVFALTGLWHGAGFTFIVWGLLNGALLLLEDHGILRVEKWRFAALRHAYTVVASVLLFTVFRADTLAQGAQMIGKMFAAWQFTAAQRSVFCSCLSPLFLLTFVAAAVLCTPLAHRLWQALCARTGRTAKLLRAASYPASLALLAVCILTLSSAGYNPFIYFRF